MKRELFLVCLLVLQTKVDYQSRQVWEGQRADSKVVTTKNQSSQVITFPFENSGAMSSRALRKLQQGQGLENERPPSDDDISVSRPAMTGARAKVQNPFDLVRQLRVMS